MEQVNNEEQISISIDYDEIPDAGSVTYECDSGSDGFGFFTDNGMVKIDEGNNDHKIVEKCFLLGMRSLARETRIVGIHKNLSSSLTGKARLDSFKIFNDAMAKKCGGDANVRYAWYGTARGEIREILCHGFSRLAKVAGNGETYGLGVHFSNSKFSIDSVLSSEVDENGLRHVLLCRLILGKMEVVPAGSKQFHPSSKEFDSGVDNLAAPSRYIMWSCSMNSHILLSYIVSFRLLCFEGSTTVPSSSQLRVSTIIKILSMFLDPPKMAVIAFHYNDFQANRIPWREFTQKVAQLAGRKLFSSILKLHGY
ncbi:hypothetical protein ACOSP7_018334 [Xanthoceras sorbifolium]|uniref:Poly [ADP-ribose] polymerase n=1 Tax=Xanthoceras sorbifolium TaxID=99658 RepID=A0ABQ8I107_9ROSI|nr:hypothetical protein JRO89_XS05G0081600 [Xanthoceras sorbifolium]